MFPTVTKSIPILAFAAITAFAGGGNNDPILGSYEGRAVYTQHGTKNGVPDPDLNHFTEADWVMEFLPAHQAVVGTHPGKWKQVGKRYAANATKAFTAAARASLLDPTATQTMTIKKIVLGTSSIHGRLKSRIKAHVDGHFIKAAAKGFIDCSEPL